MATSELILFLDADVMLPADFLQKTVKEFVDRKLDLATSYLTPISGNLLDRIGTKIVNVYYWYSQSLRPHTYGCCIFAKRTIHNRIHGFDESIFVGEDQDYALRASKFGKCGILTSQPILFSLRRFTKKGRVITSLKYMYIELYMMFFGPIRKRIFSFEYGKH